jgi:hypothetical protein
MKPKQNVSELPTQEPTRRKEKRIEKVVFKIQWVKSSERKWAKVNGRVVMLFTSRLVKTLSPLSSLVVRQLIKNNAAIRHIILEFL